MKTSAEEGLQTYNPTILLGLFKNATKCVPGSPKVVHFWTPHAIAFVYLSLVESLGEVQAKGTIYLSNIRMVFVAKNPRDNFIAFDIPLLFVHGEKLNQPLFFCKNISGYVNPVIPANDDINSVIPHSFKILFKECDCETFISLVFNLIGKVRRRYRRSRAKHRVDPLHEATKTPVNEMTRYAYVDPNDPTSIFLQQPTPESRLKCRMHQSQPTAETSI